MSSSPALAAELLPVPSSGLSGSGDRKLRILAISDVYFPRINGVSTSIATFHREYVEQGHEVFLIAPRYGSEVEDPAIARIRSRPVLFDPEDRLVSAAEVLGHAPALAARGFDVLHIQTPFLAHRLGLRLARQLGLPVLETYHTFFEEYLYHYVPFLPKTFLRYLARRFSCRQCNQVDAIVVPSQAMRDTLVRYGVCTRLETIPTGLRLGEFGGGDGAAFRAHYRIPPERPTLVHIGRVAFEKNIDFLLRVLVEVRSAVPEVLLVIAGEGPAVPRLRRLTAELGLSANVLMVGYLAREGELLDCYRAADAFVFASRTETQGLVLLEAMALGVPVVSTAIMGTRDILAAGKGALVAEDDLEDFSRKVTLLLQHHDLRRELGQEARRYAASWDAAVMARRMLDLYGDLVRRHAARVRTA